MIINNSYFIGDLFLPSMKPSITDNLNSNPLSLFIEEYSEKCLIECFGFSLYKSVLENLEGDSAKDSSEDKWKNLINGEIVVLEDGRSKLWRGLAYKSSEAQDSKNKSFIANYVYFFFERSNHISKSTKGDVKLSSKDEISANAGYKNSIAWNKFVDYVVGTKESKVFIGESDFGEYRDYYNSDNEFSLYEFIKYKNNISSDTYPNFAPKYFSKINQFGI